jgi:hypothetical protein
MLDIFEKYIPEDKRSSLKGLKGLCWGISSNVGTRLSRNRQRIW